MIDKRYSELIRLKTFDERFEYLKLPGVVGLTTFGYDRFLNQRFYRSLEWRRIRDIVIIRDNGCDLGFPGFEIYSKILIHHMNPINIKDIYEFNNKILDPEFLICVSPETHQAIHYSDKTKLYRLPPERHRGDTKLW